MTASPKTLLDHAGAVLKAGTLADSALVLIDVQDEYISGALPLAGVSDALLRLETLLARARAARAPVIHVMHHGRPGGLFDPEGPMSRIATAVAPREGEQVVAKSEPNAFRSPAFRDAVAASGRRKLILTGFMTHMCVSTTARSALSQNVGVTVVADACATRDLPSPLGGVVPAATVHEAALAELADRFAIVVPKVADIADR